MNDPEKKTPPKGFVGVRLAAGGLAIVDRRAEDEADGNRSEMIRRMLAYAVRHMPPRWKP